jgi:hypothetical protein
LNTKSPNTPNLTTENSQWHNADKQPCVTCKKWMHISNPIFFLGSGYECHRCYGKRNEPQKQKQQICDECGRPDHMEILETKTWKNVTVPIVLHQTADNKLICEPCVSAAKAKVWWAKEKAKPLKPHPSWYYTHYPPPDKCKCEFCTHKRELMMI